MPPCAYPVLLSRGSALVRTMTVPASASEIAARRPAMPLPMTRKSPRTLTHWYLSGAFARFVKWAAPFTRPEEGTVVSSNVHVGPPEGGASVEKAVRVDVTAGSRVCPIVIGHGIADRAAALLDAHGVGARRFVVSSPTIWKLHGAQIQRALGTGDPILLPEGERYKTLSSVSRVYEALIRAGADRGSAIVALGGGVLGDTAGFAAATFLRGVTLVQIPTTLLAQVDSAIGGKVGVNHALGKNLIGSFHQPAVVIVDPAFLTTLPRREFRSGLYEVIKYGMIASRGLFDRLA